MESQDVNYPGYGNDCVEAAPPTAPRYACALIRACLDVQKGPEQTDARIALRCIGREGLLSERKEQKEKREKSTG